MIPLLARYANWLHLQWPAGGVEKLPVAGTGGRTNVPGVFVCGDLTGVPLLKFALDSGVRAVRAIAADAQGRGKPANTDLVDVVILGGGVAGMAAAIEAKLQGLSFEVIEGTAPFATVADFPRGKPIFTYPMDLLPQGALQVRATVKEQLLDELRAQVERVGVPVTHARAERVVREGGALTVKLEGGGTRRARAVLIAIGRSGDFRRLGVPGESLDHVHVRLHDPADHAGRC